MRSFVRSSSTGFLICGVSSAWPAVTATTARARATMRGFELGLRRFERNARGPLQPAARAAGRSASGIGRVGKRRPGGSASGLGRIGRLGGFDCRIRRRRGASDAGTDAGPADPCADALFCEKFDDYAGVTAITERTEVRPVARRAPDGRLHEPRRNAQGVRLERAPRAHQQRGDARAADSSRTALSRFSRASRPTSTGG